LLLLLFLSFLLLLLVQYESNFFIVLKNQYINICSQFCLINSILNNHLSEFISLTKHFEIQTIKNRTKIKASTKFSNYNLLAASPVPTTTPTYNLKSRRGVSWLA